MANKTARQGASTLRRHRVTTVATTVCAPSTPITISAARVLLLLTLAASPRIICQHGDRKDQGGDQRGDGYCAWRHRHH